MQQASGGAHPSIQFWWSNTELKRGPPIWMYRIASSDMIHRRLSWDDMDATTGDGCHLPQQARVFNSIIIYFDLTNKDCAFVESLCSWSAKNKNKKQFFLGRFLSRGAVKWNSYHYEAGQPLELLANSDDGCMPWVASHLTVVEACTYHLAVTASSLVCRNKSDEAWRLIEDSKGNKKNKKQQQNIAHSQHGNCIGGLEQRVVLLSIYLVPAEEETRKRKIHDIYAQNGAHDEWLLRLLTVINGDNSLRS